MSKKTGANKKYYLGLDIGTESIGWAVTDENYKLLRANNKSLWGVRLFDEASQAKDRRMQREQRRRLERRKRRIGLLQQIFAPAINSVDKNFFARLDDSNLYGGDKREKTKFSLFSDPDFTDKTFYAKYKTIYHLRSAMMNESNPDPRLVYLALHHIVKYRGHFLQEGESTNAIENIRQPLEAIKAYLNENDSGSFNLSEENIENFRAALIEKATKTVRMQKYCECLQVSQKQSAACNLLKLIAGNSVRLKSIVTTLEEDMSVTFDCDWETKSEEVRQALQDDYSVIENAKLLYDYAQLKTILGDHKFISEGMVEKYEKHQQDLALLKHVLDEYFTKDVNCAHSKEYYEMFRDCSDKVTNYTAYCGKVKFGKKKGKTVTLQNNAKSRSYDDFCAYVKKVLTSIDEVSRGEDVKKIFDDIENKTFMPKQVSKNNSTLPYQLNLEELKAILKNVMQYPQYAFLSEVDSEGVSTYQKIKSLLTIRMPYYVGPTNQHSSNCWLVRKADGTILPWNYENIIDLEQTEQNFIERMTNYCTFVPNAKVLPKNSLLYEEYTFLNIVNAVKVNGERLPAEVKNKLSLYYATSGKNKISKKFIKDWLRDENLAEESDDITVEGFDDGVTVHRRTYYQFYKIFNSSVDEVESHRNDIEKIIKYVTIAGPEKTNLIKRVKREFAYLTETQIAAIKGLSLNGWGRYSENLLTNRVGINRETGEIVSIIDVMRNTALNFMEVWNSPLYGFKESFEKLKYNESAETISYDIVEDLYCSPAVKKQIWQTLSVVKELVGVLGCPPAKIFVEVARDPDKAEEKKRTTSRYAQLKGLYEKLKKENKDVFEERAQDTYARLIDKKPEDLQNQKLYLYFLQNGKDIYTGENIDYNHLELYDKDHIYPRSKVKDDSILNNLVLTYRKNNADKTDEYPISEAIRSNPDIVVLWKSLHKQGLMTDEKFKRLTRTTELKEEEIADFINRQLVETRQSTKEAIGLLQQIFPKPQTEVVWSKAGNVSDFRAMQKQVGEERMPRFVKCRELNDLHHAKDAYLNIVVGNVYNIRYGHNARFWIEQNKGQKLTSSAKLFDRDVKTQSVTAWIAGENGTMAQVEKTMRSNAILFTQESKVEKGKLFDVKMLPQGRNDIIPFKGELSQNKKFAHMSNTQKYGGYSSDKSAYVTLVKVKKNQTIIYKLVSVTRRFVNQIHSDDDLLRYCEDKINKGNCEYEKRRLKVEKILIPKIKINSLFEIEGALLTLSSVGTLDDRALWNNARQFKTDEEVERYFKKVIDVVKVNAPYKKSGEKINVTEYDGINNVKNKLLYDYLIESLYRNSGNAPYQSVRILSEFGEKLNGTEIRDKFDNLSLFEQCETLVEIHKAVKCNAEESNVMGIRCGRLRGSSTITSLDNKYIVHRSVTGIFENKIPLADFDKETTV